MEPLPFTPIAAIVFLIIAWFGAMLVGKWERQAQEEKLNRYPRPKKIPTWKQRK